MSAMDSVMLDELNRRFSVEGAVRFEEGPGGLTRLWVDTTEGQAEIYLQGAHVARWQPATAVHPVLFMSDKSQFAPGKPIRGGVPVVFPWFGDRSDGLPGPAHGFARTLPWEVVATIRFAKGVGVSFKLLPSQTTRDLGFDDFVAIYEVVVGPTLELKLTVQNVGDAPLTIGEALHAYFAVSDIHQVEVSGLEGAEYLDKVDGMKRKRQEAAIRFAGETDELHVNTTVPVTIHDPGWRRRVVIEKRGSASTVVWNPWTEKAGRLTDLGEEAWPHFVCVEPANAAENAVTVQPGAVHVMSAKVSIESL
jgi:glucose-6-phosphate 1-epimerase